MLLLSSVVMFVGLAIVMFIVLVNIIPAVIVVIGLSILFAGVVTVSPSITLLNMLLYVMHDWHFGRI